MPSSPARRTQADRRSATRLALLEATISCLVDLGYARTTTTEVVKRAGVSQGALFKHFPTRAALIAAAAEKLFDDLVEDFRRAFEAEAKGEDRIVVALRRLWDVFCHPRIRAVYLLYAEAPADDELRAALVPVVANHSSRVASFGRTLFPEIVTSQALQSLFDAVVLAMQGASLQRGVWLDPERERRTLAYLEHYARLLIPSVPAPTVSRPSKSKSPKPTRARRTS